MPPRTTAALGSSHSFTPQDAPFLHSLLPARLLLAHLAGAALPLPDCLTLDHQSSCSSRGFPGRLRPGTDLPDIYAYVKDLGGLGVLAGLCGGVHMEREGRVLLRGLHVVPQARLGESQQLCVSVGVCAQPRRETVAYLPSPPTSPFSQLPHTQLCPSCSFSPAQQHFSPPPQPSLTCLPSPLFFLSAPRLLLSRGRGSPPGTAPASTTLTCR